MKSSRVISAFFLSVAAASSANAGAQALELDKLGENAWGEDWAGGCWFHEEFLSDRSGGELMFLIRGEGKGGVAVLSLDGKVEEVPFSQTLSKSKAFRMGARDSYLYRSADLKIKVTTIVTEVPTGNECAGDCNESSGFAAEIEISKGARNRRYEFKAGACGL